LSSSSIFSQLLAQILLLSFDDETPRGRTSPASTYPASTYPVATNSVTENSSGFILELLRLYSQNITDYNTNILHYNRNMERIIRLLETESRSSNNSILDTERRSTNEFPQTPPAQLNALRPRFVAVVPDISGTTLTDVPNPRSRGRSTPGLLSNNTSRIRFATRPYISGYYRTNEIQHYTNIINTIRNPRIPSVLSTGGLTETQIQYVTIEVVYDSSNASMPTQCHISLDEFIHGEPLLQIRNCNHMFKPAGLRRWLSQVSRCPVCRCDVMVEQGSHENVITSNNPTANNPTEIEDYSDMPDLIADSDSDSDSETDYSDMPELVD
jgi:hypothetical protein